MDRVCILHCTPLKQVSLFVIHHYRSVANDGRKLFFLISKLSMSKLRACQVKEVHIDPRWIFSLIFPDWIRRFQEMGWSMCNAITKELNISKNIIVTWEKLKWTFILLGVNKSHMHTYSIVILTINEINLEFCNVWAWKCWFAKNLGISILEWV